MWRQFADTIYRLESGPRWWLWYAPLVVLLVLAAEELPDPWNWVVRVPFAIVALLLIDGRARRQRDETRRRVDAAQHRG